MDKKTSNYKEQWLMDEKSSVVRNSDKLMEDNK